LNITSEWEIRNRSGCSKIKNRFRILAVANEKTKLLEIDERSATTVMVVSGGY
jgi:hypothetical protein